MFQLPSRSAKGGGGRYRSSGDATLSGNTIAANTAGSGGGLDLWSSAATLTNTVVADNQASTAGSGLYIERSSPHLLHTTIAHNTGGDGSGVYVTNYGSTYSTVALNDTILVSHTVGITVTAGNTAMLEGTLWGSGAWANGADWGGAGTIVTGTVNVWGKPGFVDPDSGDYHITAASAAVDAGVDAGVTTDVDGHHRPYGSAPDLGADELIATSVPTDTGSTLVYTDTQGSPTVIQVPAGAVTETTTLVYTPVETATTLSGFAFAGHAFDLDAYRNGVLLSGFTFSTAVTITIHYTDTDVAGMDESSLVLEHWNGSAWVDAACGLYDRHPDENWLSVPICHLSQFALFGEQRQVYLPLILRNY